VKRVALSELPTTSRLLVAIAAAAIMGLIRLKKKPDDVAVGVFDGCDQLSATHILQSVQVLDPQRATESPGGIVRGCTVVIHEDSVVATITKEGTAEPSNIRRCFYPARRFQIEISKFL
jgi:hypothetical protein